MEYKMKCNVCGKIFCYTDEDLKQNASNAGMAALSALGGLASTLGGGTILHTHHLQGQADRYNDKVVDYNQCPYCHSRDLSFYHGEDNTQGKDSATLDAPAVSAKNINTTASTESLLKRAFIFLEDGDWASADAYSESCLDRDPELAEAYLAKLMVEKKAHSLEELGNSKAPLSESKYYQKVIRYGNEVLVAQLKELCGNAEKNVKRLAEIRERLNDPDCSVMLDVMDGHIVALCADGSIQTCNNRDGVCNSDKWKDLISIEMGYSNTVGLRADGTVVACGENTAINDGVSKWKDIKAIRIAGDFVAGLRRDGTVVACGKNGFGFHDEEWEAIVRNTKKWKDIVKIDATTDVVVGLCRDGTVKYGETNAKAYSYISNLHNVIDVKANSYQIAVSYQNGTVELISSSKQDAKWEDVKSVSEPFLTNLTKACMSNLCLRNDGTVFTWKDDDELPVSEWHDIVAIGSGIGYAVGLTKNGTVVACGNNKNGQCEVADWNDIVAVRTNDSFLTIGIRADGSVVCCGCGSGDSQKVDCSTLKLFNDIADLDANIARNRELRIAAEKAAEERRIAAEKAAEEKRKICIAQLEWEKQNLQAEIPNIKGIFAGSKKRKIESRITEINAELEKLMR